MKSTAPIVQKKLIDNIARYSVLMCMVALTSFTDDRMICQSIPLSCCSGGAGGT